MRRRMYGYNENYPEQQEMSLAETIGSSIAPAGVRLPASPSQFEAVYMDMGAINLPTGAEQSPPRYPPPQQQVVGSWEDEYCKPVQVKQEEQSDSGSDWGGTGSVTTEDSPPKPRRGRLPMNDESLTPYERQKKERRREQNRRAARKCREKRKQHQDVIFQDYYRLKDENTRLREENARIAAERERLGRILRAHQATCSMSSVPVSHVPSAPRPADPAPPQYGPPALPHSPLTAPSSAASSSSTIDQSLDEIADFVFEASAYQN